MEEDVPIHEEDVSPQLCDFVRKCMHRDPWKRPSAHDLMQHPFVLKVSLPLAAEIWSGLSIVVITTSCMLDRAVSHPVGSLQYIAQPVSLREFMRCMYSAEEKLEDAVRIMASRFYNNLAYNYKDSDSIAAYYAAEAVRDMPATYFYFI